MIEIVHPPLVDQADFDAAQQLLGRRGRGRRPGQEYHRERTRHSYIFRGLVYCSLCHRKMQGQRSHGENYYRCRYPHPLDAALAEAFAPDRVSETITAMVDSQDQPDTGEASVLARSRLAEYDRKLAPRPGS